MHLHRRPFRWPCGGIEAIHAASPDGGCPGPYRSHQTPPLGDYLLRIAPADARTTINLKTMTKYTYFVGRFDGHRDAAVRYRVHRPMEGVQGFTRSHWMPPSGEHSLRQHAIGHTNTGFVRCFSSSNRRKSHKTTRIAPNNNRGMTYQNDEKHLTSMREYFVGGVSIAFNLLNNRFLLRVITQ